jgi:hypothetical protein
MPEGKVPVASLYSAFLDERGTHKESKIVVVAGFISNVTQTEELSEEWKKALNLWGIPMFHMADFESRRGCFEQWTDDQRRDRLNHLLDLMKCYTFNSIAFVVRKKSFDKIFTAKAKRRVGDAYGIAAIGCWHNLALVAKDQRIDGYIRFTMEKGCRGVAALKRIHDNESTDPGWVKVNRIESLSFQDKRTFLPLQAADIMAYEIYKQAHRQFDGEIRPTRYPLRELASPGHQWHYATDEELKRVHAYLVRVRDWYR